MIDIDRNLSADCSRHVECHPEETCPQSCKEELILRLQIIPELDIMMDI